LILGPPAATWRLVLWRHGRTSWNVERRFQGHLDVGLDDLGRAQARRAAELLARLRPDAIVSSDLGRATETARALAELTGLEVVLDAGLRETHGGVWQGQVPDELVGPDRAAYDAWRAGGPDARPPGGESREEVAERTYAAVSRAVAALPAGGTVVAVTHGGAGPRGHRPAARPAAADLDRHRRARQLLLVGAQREGPRGAVAARRAQRGKPSRAATRRGGLISAPRRPDR
jgi:probable phosphoglycerate mutase